LHFVLTFEIIFLVRQTVTIAAASANGRCLLFAIFYAEQNIVGVGVFLLNIIGVVAGHNFHIVALRHFNKHAIYALFVLLVVAHNFHIKIFAKLILPP